MQKALFAQYSESCSSDQLSDPACIEGLAEVLYEGAPDLQKRFLPVLPVLAVVVAAEGLVVGILAEIMRNSGQPVSVLHYESSVLVALQDVSTATTASVILVETTTGDSQAISISTTELTSFNPSSTISTAPRYVTSNPNGRLYL